MQQETAFSCPQTPTRGSMFLLVTKIGLGNTMNPKNIFRGKFFWCMLFNLPVICSSVWNNMEIGQWCSINLHDISKKHNDVVYIHMTYQNDISYFQHVSKLFSSHLSWISRQHDKSKNIFRDKFFWCMLFNLICSSVWKNISKNTMMFYKFTWHIKMKFDIFIMSQK